MIIVKTSNGDVFINDKVTIIVAHDREAKKVHVQTNENWVDPIENVEGVIYTNDAQPTSWQDEGSTIQRLRETIDKLEKEVDDANALSRFSRQAYMQLAKVVDRLRSQLQMKENARSWDDIECCLASADKSLDEIKKERDKIMAIRLA
jgi:hypothetical protein